MSTKREKKAERREAKAARKAANQITEKSKRPSNLILGLMIFGVLIGMFVFIWGYNYSQKEDSIQSYIKNNGGKAAFSNMDMGDGSYLSVTAKKNDMKVVIELDVDKSYLKDAKKYYKEDDTKEYIEYIAAYYLTDIKPQTKAFFASSTYSVKINDKNLYKEEISYREAKKFIEEYTEKMEAEQSESDTSTEE